MFTDPMTPETYRRHREAVGTQQAAADALGVDRVTVCRRETNAIPITPEAALAIVGLRNLYDMHSIFHSTVDGQPGEARFGIFLDHSDIVTRAVIVCASLFLYNADHGRDAVLNQIIASQLPGVRIEFIRFIAVPNPEAREPSGREFVIHPDLKAHRKTRPLLARRDPVCSTELLGGAATVFTRFDDGTPLDPAVTIEMLRKVGLR